MVTDSPGAWIHVVVRMMMSSMSCCVGGCSRGHQCVGGCSRCQQCHVALVVAPDYRTHRTDCWGSVISIRPDFDPNFSHMMRGRASIPSFLWFLCEQYILFFQVLDCCRPRNKQVSAASQPPPLMLAQKPTVSPSRCHRHYARHRGT